MSGYTEDEIIRGQILLDASAFVEKPFTPAPLLNALRLSLSEQDAGASGALVV